jgi:hypothetical protein
MARRPLRLTPKLARLSTHLVPVTSSAAAANSGHDTIGTPPYRPSR